MKAIYDIKKSYLENAEDGPFFSGKLPSRVFPPEEQWEDFLGFKVASKIGVPAGPLLNSRWISFGARAGFDILTYKTIRSKEHPAHPLPNMVYVETPGFLSSEQEGGALKMTDVEPADMEHLAVTNSFGIPSRTPEYLIKDIHVANASLAPGQVMIVSVSGTPRPGVDFVEDFVDAGRLALAGGAKILEANFSCPNVITCEGSVHTSPDAVYTISKRIIDATKIPLIIKIGVIIDEKVMKDVMVAAARAGVRAICGINALSMRVENRDGSASLGENRAKSGICGGPIRMATLDFIDMAKRINDREKLGLIIMATGGVTLPEHFDEFFAHGADVAMTATGMMWDPLLGIKYHAKRN